MNLLTSTPTRSLRSGIDTMASNESCLFSTGVSPEPGDGVEFHFVRNQMHLASSSTLSSEQVGEPNVQRTKSIPDESVDHSKGPLTPFYATAVKRHLPKQISPSSDLSLLFPPELGGKNNAPQSTKVQKAPDTLYSKINISPSDTGSLLVSLGNIGNGEDKRPLPDSIVNVPRPAFRDSKKRNETGKQYIEIFEKELNEKVKKTPIDSRSISLKAGIQNESNSIPRAVLRISKGAAKVGQLSFAGKVQEFDKIEHKQACSIKCKESNAAFCANGSNSEVPVQLPKSTRDACGQTQDGKENAAEEDARFRPLKDIKRWSIAYFLSHNPALAAEIASYDTPNWSPSRPVSEADTRSISGASELLVYQSESVSLAHQAEWLDFTGQRNTDHDERLPNLVIRAQLCDWDGDFMIPGQDTFESACWSIGHDVAANVDHWIDMNVDIKHRYLMDTNTSTFKSGASRPSGLVQNRYTWPADALYETLDPDFEAINWNDIPIRRAPHDAFLTPFQARQSSELCRQIILEPYKQLVSKIEMEKSKPHEKSESRKKKSQLKEMIKAQCAKDVWAPELNFYVRPARNGDLAQICRIYNEWVDSSIVTKDLAHRELSCFEDAVVQCRNAGLPFLVAASGSAQRIRQGNPSRLRRNVFISQGLAHFDTDNHLARQERIMGYTCAEPLCGFKGDVFRGVVEVKVFTDPHYLRQGIGKTLLDQALSFTIPFYVPHKGTAFVYDEPTDGLHYKFNSFCSPSPIRKVLVELLWETKDREKFEWKKRVLEETFGFQETAFMSNLGERENRHINQTTFVRDALRY